MALEAAAEVENQAFCGQRTTGREGEENVFLLMAFVVSCVVREPRKYRQNQQVAEIEIFVSLATWSGISW